MYEQVGRGENVEEDCITYLLSVGGETMSAIVYKVDYTLHWAAPSLCDEGHSRLVGSRAWRFLNKGTRELGV